MGAHRFDRCPNGIPGVEPRLSLLFSEGVARGRLTETQLVELACTAPARFFGLFPRKGTLRPGSDADIVLFDPQAQWIMGQNTLHMASDWSAYENITVTGRIVRVFSRGELIIDGRDCLAETGRGRYMHRRISV